MFLLFIVLTLSVPQQPREVVEAYEVCQKFQTLMAEDLDFNRAFEATFTKSPTRRREIAIAEGEFGNIDTARVDDALLIDAFKSRMLILYLMMPLMSPDTKRDEAVFFPPRIKAIFERKAPKAPSRFRAFSLQLRRDAAYLRAHLERLAKDRPDVAERIRKFKQEVLSTKLEPPNDVVKPLTAYSRGRVLGLDEPYYQIGNYAVAREGNEMRIIGIRFFTRLF
ncbi:MAG TPA: hypothetical protein VFB70_17120 [Pyrinomonadaceae bacterium]|nr:hypothetical protein [Pyrinomonadaceae bacterium]